MALTARDRQLISWLQDNYGFTRPVGVGRADDGLVRLVLGIPAPNATEAMHWALQIVADAQRNFQRHDRRNEPRLATVECWRAGEPPPTSYAATSIG
ncbi:MAG TPA: hypothetical protein VN895_04070 [Candidatus Acidoferrum sp.]|nr:hypothetical protein [Candidatus Acidoferrum sp.]